ncbi:leucyl-tRNA synthetase [Isosphaera pallida ATCC 43644]|uniref:Leucine--tRNA ligase n=1 Tax=Isosphaera pallida (strain ATCC 43644 / DSM 9630 / IS1B) TaxID=575540 RepID=E8R5V1_ISOPI|nr:leucine--tRNA ligase [Isosphaera pallida]ADV62858.1 leucyl-tRNA synthetase [Isosphaera pallida ATCC 43644]
MPAYHFQRIESKWQAYWRQHRTFRAPDLPARPKLYVLDMFPYPSGDGLHVGHPEGYTATDIYARYKRMRGYDVLHPMGWDAFGLPAEQHAIKTGTHPGAKTQANIATFKRQIESLGFSYDWDREIDTTDPNYYRWTQWIFLQLFDTWYDPDFEWTDPQGRSRRGKGRPIAELPIPPGIDPYDYRDSKRLAYRAEVPVNWCPELGTVLANEEVVDGKSEVGGFPVIRLPLKQWMLRITAYADRLLEDLDLVDWPEPIKDMQRNWIGRSEGAEVDFPLAYPDFDFAAWSQARAAIGFPPPQAVGHQVIRIYTTRPDTLFGATYMVLAPEHPLVDRITTPEQRDAVAAYRRAAAAKSDLDRTDLAKTKTGVATGAFAVNPVTGQLIPVWIADYVLMGYGTGAIMAVPGHDERDFEFARAFGLPIRRVVAAALDQADQPLDQAETAYAVSVNSANAELKLDGLPSAQAKVEITNWLTSKGFGRKAVNTKLRDWLFSRQRYWGEPFPILLDDQDRAHPVPVEQLPVRLPELADFKPTGKPEPPLSKAVAWVNEIPGFRRETNTMPQWAGSCWYYLRYIDPRNDQAPWDPAKERAWMPVDLYIGGAEHAVLHLLYSRFWHKVLFDRGYVSHPEPFQRLVNQGMILGEIEYHAYQTEDGRLVSVDHVIDTPQGPTLQSTPPDAQPIPVRLLKLDPAAVVKTGSGFVMADHPEIKVEGRASKMSKSRGNVINPDGVVAEYGADSLRLYEMFMGPLEATKPWSMKGVEGVYRFLNRAWRMIVDEEAETPRLHPKVVDIEPSAELVRLTARTIAAVTEDLEGLRFNTAISRLMEFVNAVAPLEARPKAVLETFTLLLAPMAPHIAEELWEVLGHATSLAYHPWPTYDPNDLKEDRIEIPVQINGKLRGKVVVDAQAEPAAIEEAARAEPRIAELLRGKTIRKAIVAKGKLVNFVVS